ncbi:MAG: sigma-70 family RNA polymerase sigma factor [Clostridia bacterium]|nr:sigma-70 family RNA polymerase sigma factor [Clostridia bacterium]
MERKNYLVEKLSAGEMSFLKQIIINERRKYIRNNFYYLSNQNINYSDLMNVEGETVLDAVINKCEEDIKSAIEFEKVTSDGKLFRGIKALSLKEKMVLFSLYKENKGINQIAYEMEIDRTTAWRIKNRALDKLMRTIIGGTNNV